jgi:large subunit ribosomal protein L25
MENVSIQATTRGTGRHSNRESREAGRVPAVVYGKGQESLAVSMDRKLLGIALHKAGGRPIEMSIADGPTLHVLAREIQRHQTKHAILHVDFLAVSMTEKVRVSVTVMPEGHPPAVTASGDLVLVRNLDSVEVECLPGDIPEHIMADMSTLLTVHDEIRVRELKAADGVKVLSDPEQVVFAITMSRAGAVEEGLEETASADEVEVVKKGKKDEDEGA